MLEKVLYYTAVIIVVILAGWFILEIVDRLQS